MAEEEGVIHDEVEIEDFEYDEDTDTFKYPCPCGDEFLVSRVRMTELVQGSKYAKCPSCSLMVLVVYNAEDLDAILESKSICTSSAAKKSAQRLTN